MKTTIVCVDDDPVVLDALKTQLVRRFSQSCWVETVANAQETLELLAELAEEGQSVSLVLTDWLLPKTKGDELLEAIADLHPHVHLMLMSAEAEPLDVSHLYNLPQFAGYVPKPWDKADLMEKVSRCVERQAAFA